jgi:hypothetical protein
MMLPFLEYINKPEHKWVCCIGVPYATHIWQVGDASGLNGAFTTALAKAKREYIKHCEKPTFEPTDLIPLLNKAWEKSFNNRKNAVPVIAHHSWNPLNYDMLDCIKLSGTASSNIIDLRAASKDDNKPTPLIIPRPNINGGIGSLFIEKILEEEWKSDGRMEKFKKMKTKMKTREEKVEQLRKLTEISSAVLASYNHYTLDEAVLDRMQEKHDQAEEEKRVAEAKRSEKQRAADEKFYKTAEKCVSGKPLTVDDMKCLISRAKLSIDSPVKSKKVDVELQYIRRKQ